MTKKTGNIIKLNGSTTVFLLEELLELAKKGKLKNIVAVGDTTDKEYFLASSSIDIHDTYRFVGYLTSYAAVESFMTMDFDDLE